MKKMKHTACAVALLMAVNAMPMTAFAAEGETSWWQSAKEYIFGSEEKSEEKTAEEKTAEEKTAEEKTTEEKTAEEKTAEEKTAEAAPEEKPAEPEGPTMSERAGEAMDSVKENVFAFNRGVRDGYYSLRDGARETYDEIDVASFKEYMPEVDIKEFGDQVHNRLQKIHAASQEVGNGNGDKIKEVLASRLRPLEDTETQKRLAKLAIQKIIANREEIVRIITSPDMSDTMLEMIQATDDYAALTMTKGITTENIGPLLRSSFELGCAALSVYQGEKSVGQAAADVTYVVVKEGTVQYIGSAARMATEAALLTAGAEGAPVIIIAFAAGQAVQYVVHAAANDEELRNDLIALTDLVVSKENFLTFMEFVKKAME